MEYLNFEKVREGRYLKNYEITYLNNAGKKKVYEMVSMTNLQEFSQVGKKTSGLSIVATVGDKLLLLREFRMGIGRTIYNLCAGMIEDGETLESCIQRELYEETGLKLKEIRKILPPSFASVGISDIRTSIAFVEAEGELAFHGSHNEQITPLLFSREELLPLLQTADFSSRSQIIATFFAHGMKL